MKRRAALVEGEFVDTITVGWTVVCTYTSATLERKPGDVSFSI